MYNEWKLVIHRHVNVCELTANFTIYIRIISVNTNVTETYYNSKDESILNYRSIKRNVKIQFRIKHVLFLTLIW